MNRATGVLEAWALNPLDHLGLPLTPTQLRTTKHQIFGTYRLAGLHQTAADAPPPAVPDGALGCVQLHESAINNVLQGLELEGREGRLQALCHDLCLPMGLEASELERLPRAIALKFADEQPAHIRFHDGQVEVVVRLASFSIGEKQWRDLTIRCAYRFDDESRLPVLNRVGKVNIEGGQLSMVDRLVLNGVFARMLACADRIPMFPDAFGDHPVMANLVVAQRHVDHGWLSLALGSQPSRDALVAEAIISSQH